VSVAEDGGLVSQLTMAVVNSSLRNLAAMVRTDPNIDISVSVNVSARNLVDAELPDFIAQALQTWRIPARQLVIEVTEGAMIGDVERTIETLHRLKEIGVSLSVDDFGTGYSSLAYLKRMPLDELKIDQIFVRNMLTSKPDERIVRSVIDLARHFDLKVVAEGAEDDATLEFLRTLGVDVVQGYLISKPMPASQFGWWFRACHGRLRPAVTDESHLDVASGIWQSPRP
jgi:EAL domain-containing protein (putative c-di-GMP-specific phosphodiesterase class I)